MGTIIQVCDDRLRADIWDQAEEILCSLRELTDDELMECRHALADRAKIIMSLADWEREHPKGPKNV